MVRFKFTSLINISLFECNKPGKNVFSLLTDQKQKAPSNYQTIQNIKMKKYTAFQDFLCLISNQGLIIFRIGSKANIVLALFSLFFSHLALNLIAQPMKFLPQKPQYSEKDPTPKMSWKEFCCCWYKLTPFG